MRESPTATPQPPSARLSFRFVVAGVAAVMLAVIFTVVLNLLEVHREVAGPLALVAWLVPLVLFAWGGLRSVGAMALGLAEQKKGTPWGAFIVATGLSLLGFVLTLGMLVGFTRGRQLRRRGRLLLPALSADSGWQTVSLEPVVPPTLRAPLAARWRQNGRTEHASVAAFAQLTLDLMSLGAPPALLATAQRDALDEIRHAELCFSLAEALDGQAQGPAPFRAAATTRALPPVREWALAQLAVDSLVEGALLEGFSARLISKLVTHCEDPAIAVVLRELASDEGRHSRHGWDVVDWCLFEGGLAVAHALSGAVRALPSQASTTALTTDQALEPYGIASRALEQVTYSETRAYVIERVGAMLAVTKAA